MNNKSLGWMFKGFIVQYNENTQQKAFTIPFDIYDLSLISVINES